MQVTREFIEWTRGVKQCPLFWGKNLTFHKILYC